MGNRYEGALYITLHDLDWHMKDFLYKLDKNEINPPWDLTGKYMNYSFYNNNCLIVHYYSEEKNEEVIENMINFLKQYITPSKKPLGTIEHDINGYKKSYYYKGNEDCIYKCPNCGNILTKVSIEYKNAITYSNYRIDENLILDEHSEELDDYIEFGESYLGDNVFCGICEEKLPEELASKILNLNVDARTINR